MLADVIPLVMSYVLLNITTENFYSNIGGYFLQNFNMKFVVLSEKFCWVITLIWIMYIEFLGLSYL